MGLLTTLFLLVVTYLIGAANERRHYRSIEAREELHKLLVAVNFQTLPAEWEAQSCGLVTGSVVISLDYFKRVIAGLRGIIGGRIRTYEPLLDRARREAVLRMKEDAIAHGFDAIVNLRLDTSRLASARSDGKGTAGIEILAFGTGLKLTNLPEINS